MDARAGNRFHSIEVGGALSHGYTNGASSRLRIWEPGEYALTIDVGFQRGFGSTDGGIGASYEHNFTRDTAVTLSAAAGNSIFFPELLWGVSFRTPVRGLGATGGYLRRQWSDGGYSNEVSGGADRWFAHWIVGGYVRYHWGEPNRFRSVGGGVGVSYYVWKKQTIGAGFDLGDERYREPRPGLQPKGVNAGYSRWLDATSGVNVRVNHGWSTYAGEITGVSASFFKEW